MITLAGVVSAADRPNILWITAEDMNPWMRCYGTRIIKTPTFDKLSKEGVRFDRAYVPAPVCSACRSAIITGTMQTTLGIHNHRSSRKNAKVEKHMDLGMIHLPKGVKTVPELFRDAGYRTFNQGKTDYNFVYDLKTLYDSRGWEDAEDKPWFGQIQLKGGKNGAAVFGRNKKNPVDPGKVEVPPYYPDHPVYRNLIADHYYDVMGTDHSVRQILDRLKKDGLSKSTIVFFYSDHGMPAGLRHKQFCYEGGIRVPLIVSAPGHTKLIRTGGKVRGDLVNLIDVAVTSLALAGIKIPDHMEGRDLFAKNHKPREFVVSARDRCDYTIERIRAVTTKRYKYLKNFLTDRPYLQPQYRDGREFTKVWKELYKEGKLNAVQSAFVGPERPSEEFYDLDKDPHEIRNLAKDSKYATEFARHRKILIDWMKETDDKGQYGESTEGLLQVMYRWGKKCVNPEYDAVRKKYGEVEPPPRKKGKRKKKK